MQRVVQIRVQSRNQTNQAVLETDILQRFVTMGLRFATFFKTFVNLTTPMTIQEYIAMTEI